MPSLCRLLDTFHAPFSDTKPNYEMIKAGLVMGLEENLRVRQRLPAMNILDIYYREIIGASADLATKIYQFFDMPLRDESVQNMRHWEASNPIHKLGTFRYDMADYQLTPTGLNRDFRRITNFCGAPFLKIRARNSGDFLRENSRLARRFARP